MGEWRVSFDTRGLTHLLRQRPFKSLLFAALTCTVRPTAAITWVFLYGVLLWRLRHDLRAVGRVLFQAVYIGFVVTPAQAMTLALTV